jgi:hypothetical protein
MNTPNPVKTYRHKDVKRAQIPSGWIKPLTSRARSDNVKAKKL